MDASQATLAKRRRTILADLEAALARQFGHPDQAPEALRQQVEAWRELQQQLATVNEERQLCARSFGPARREGRDLAPLKATMQDITHRLRSLEERQSALEEALLAELGGEQDPPQDGCTAAARSVPALPPRLTARAPTQGEPGSWRVERYQPEQAAAWDHYVDQHPRATAWHHSLWRPLLTDCHGHGEASLLARDDRGEVVGVLPLMRLRSRLFGDFSVSMPCFNYGGPLANHQAIEQDLLQQAAEQARRQGQDHLEIRNLHPCGDWPSRSDKVGMLRALPERIETLDRELGSKIRAQVRRARREQPQLQFGRHELLDDFYAVFARNMRDLGTPVYSRRFFSEVLARWPDSELVTLRLNHRPVGAGLLLSYRDTLEIPWASTLREVNPLGINMLMYWEVLCRAIEQGHAYFDFGRSSEGSGTYRFKQQWGAQPLASHWQYWLPEGRSMPGLNPDNPRYQLLIRSWQRLPVLLTRWLGPWIVRRLP